MKHSMFAGAALLGATFLLFQYTNFVYAVPPGSSCRTPNMEPAFCIPFKSCRPLVTAIKANVSFHEFARQSECFRDEYMVYVCCGTENNFTTEGGPYPPLPSKRGRLPSRKICGRQHTDDRVYTENVTAIDEFPWMVIIKFKNDYDGKMTDFMCSGSLINRRYVLTSAECVSLNKVGLHLLLTAGLGEYHRTNSTDCENSLGFPECAESIENINVEEVILHPNYTGYPRFTNNIALLRLDRQIPFSDYIRPICLPDENTVPLNVNDQIITSGWGITDISNLQNNTWDNLEKRYSVLKKRSQNKIVVNDFCIEEEGLVAFWNNFENQFCTKNDTNCLGDSGGPAMVNDKRNLQWIQHAVYLTANRCKNINNKGVYEKLYHHMDWIKTQLFD